MFKRRAAGQRIYPSEMTAHSIAPAPMTPSDSTSVDLAYHRAAS